MPSYLKKAPFLSATLAAVVVGAGAFHPVAAAPGHVVAPPYALRADVAPDAVASGAKYEASIIPASTFALGNSLSVGPDGKSFGHSMTANGIEGDWNCSGTCDLDFAIWVFASASFTANVEFKIVSCGPTGSAKTCSTSYSYTFTSQSLGTGGAGYSVLSKAKYATSGTYFAEIYVGSQLAGWIPIVINVKG